MQPMSQIERSKNENQKGWYPDDTLQPDWRDMLEAYTVKFLSFSEHTHSMCPPLPVVSVVLDARLGKLYGSSGFQLTDAAKRTLALCQPHKAHLFGLDVKNYLHPARKIFSCT